MTSNTQATAQMTWSERYQAFAAWNRKGFKWAIPSILIGPLVIWGVNPLTELAESSDLTRVIIKWALVAIQFGCCGRMVFCYWRANRFMRERS